MGAMFANEVIVISQVIDNILRHKYNRCDCKLIYNGVPTPQRCDLSEYFDELGIEKGRYVLAMCRFVPEKNLHHLVEAFAKCEHIGYKLVLAGDADFEDDYSRSLKKMAIDSGVVLTGFVKGEKLHSLLTGARCFVLPSSHEGLPISLLEAMSYSLPVVVSDIPANMEVGLPSDNYFHVGDVEELSQKLGKMLSTEFSAVEYDMKSYDWDVIADQVAHLYSSMHSGLIYKKGLNI